MLCGRSWLGFLSRFVPSNMDCNSLLLLNVPLVVRCGVLCFVCVVWLLGSPHPVDGLIGAAMAMDETLIFAASSRRHPPQ